MFKKLLTATVVTSMLATTAMADLYQRIGPNIFIGGENNVTTNPAQAGASCEQGLMIHSLSDVDLIVDGLRLLEDGDITIMGPHMMLVTFTDGNTTMVYDIRERPSGLNIVSETVTDGNQTQVTNYSLGDIVGNEMNDCTIHYPNQ